MICTPTELYLDKLAATEDRTAAARWALLALLDAPAFADEGSEEGGSTRRFSGGEVCAKGGTNGERSEGTGKGSETGS